ncbi:hypothetical protein [Streptomyces sp. NPDC026673]|uniref:hypothetical protein n=1 Tax=Streptomyces sp. NPDC026673 TaxID=3155724 RepID=UPI0033CFD045
MTTVAPSGNVDVPPEHAVLVVDMKDYSQIAEARMAPVRGDLDDILTTVFAHSGIVDIAALDDGSHKDRGDGAIFVLPARHTARLVDPFLGHLSRALDRYDQTRLASAPRIRLRASVHVGPLAPPNHRGDAINDACRLVDSDEIRHAMAAAVDNSALLAAVVSDTVFRRTVRANRTPSLAERQFLKAIARVEGKPGFEEVCWLHVPGLLPATLGPYLSGGDDGAPQEPQGPAPQPPSGNGGAPSEHTARVQQKGRASGKSRLIQVGRDYTTTGREQS